MTKTNSHSFRFLLSIAAIFAIAITLLFSSCNCSTESSVAAVQLRAPAYPLITIDPYMSTWAETDLLFDDAVKHWTGKNRSLIGALRVDSQIYRFLGKESIPWKPLLPMAGGKGW